MPTLRLRPQSSIMLLGLLLLFTNASAADGLPPMLDLPITGGDPGRIDFTTMPILRGDHAIISHGNAPWPFRNHNYLAWFDGRYWAMWSHGLRQEDYPEQHVQYSTCLLYTSPSPRD